MRVSAKAEHACVAMLELARMYNQPQPARLKAIAEAHGMPQRFLVQILLQLKAAGLVASIRGAAGGYQLTRPPDQISLADVINAIDRSPTPRRGGGAPSPTVQAVRSVWEELDAAEQRRLREISLADLVRRVQPAGELLYQI